MPYSVDTVDGGVPVRLRGWKGMMRGVFMGYGGLSYLSYKEGSSFSSSPNTPYLRVTLLPSFPSRELCYKPENGEGELD